MTYRLDFTDDPRTFLRQASAYLGADPVLTTVVVSVTARAVESLEAGRPAPEHPRWWLSVVDEGTGAVVGAVMRTAPFRPHPLYALPVPAEAARLLAARLVERGEPVSAVNGALPTVHDLASELARLGGTRAHVHEHTRLHVLGELREPRDPAGRARLAGPDDLALVAQWFESFHTDAAAQAGRLRAADHEPEFDLEEVRTRIDAGRVWLWEDGLAAPVSMVGHNPPGFGVARVGPVFTPAESRGHGYASALTAHVSRLLRDAGHRVCLFTDQANPVSNRVYAALGYEPVVDMAHLVIARPAPPPPKLGR